MDKHPLASALVPMNVFATMGEPILIDLVYANQKHEENIFKTALYHPDALLSLHKDLARIVLLAARSLHKSDGWVLVLKDGLRTIEAQARMMETEIVRQNPQWLEEPRMLSSPGQGGHPRGMAVDVAVIDHDGKPVDMGTVFDCMTALSARDYTGFSPAILKNRKTLEEAMMAAAQDCSLPLLPLPNEWWDFRFPSTHYAGIAGLSDNHLPPPLYMCATPQQTDADMVRLEALAKSILLSL